MDADCGYECPFNRSGHENGMAGHPFAPLRGVQAMKQGLRNDRNVFQRFIRDLETRSPEAAKSHITRTCRAAIEDITNLFAALDQTTMTPEEQAIRDWLAGQLNPVTGGPLPPSKRLSEPLPRRRVVAVIATLVELLDEARSGRTPSDGLPSRPDPDAVEVAPGTFLHHGLYLRGTRPSDG